MSAPPGCSRCTRTSRAHFDGVSGQFLRPSPEEQSEQIENMHVALVGRGHHVALATLQTAGLATHEIDKGVHIHRMQGTFQRLTRVFSDPERPHLPPAPDPRAAKALRRIIDDERPDVIHAHDWFVHSLIGQQRRRRVPLLLSLHDHSLTCANKRLMQGREPCSGPATLKCLRCASDFYGIVKGIPTAIALQARSRRVTAAVDRFLPVSTSVAELSGIVGGDTPVDVLPNFISDHDFAIADADDEPRDADLPPDGFVLFFGDATHDKGIEVLLDAHRRLVPRPTLVVMGRALSPALEDAPADVLVIGSRAHDEALRTARRAAVVVVPSLWAEPFGLVALEAMAVGTPVVAARRGGLAEMVIDGESGLLTSAGDAVALAAAIQSLLDDDALRGRLGAGARRRAEEFRTDRVVGALERSYSEAIASSAAAEPERRGAM